LTKLEFIFLASPSLLTAKMSYREFYDRS
jgi:hypothetical protein